MCVCVCVCVCVCGVCVHLPSVFHLSSGVIRIDSKTIIHILVDILSWLVCGFSLFRVSLRGCFDWLLGE